MNNTAALAAVSFGAVAIEKHFRIDKEQKGPDSSFSIEPNDLKYLKLSTKECWEAIGTGNFQRSSSEAKNRIFRRSLYFVEDMEIGQMITKKHIKRLRPGFGLPPKFIEFFLNKKLKKSVERGDRVTWDCIK